MEENLMERLLNDFSGVLEEFNQLVASKDIEGIKKVLEEVNTLILEQNGIVLDDREPQYDHVLHEFLSKIAGTFTELESSIPNYENQINDIKETNINELISNLKDQTVDVSDLEARRATLESQRTAAANRYRETKGFDEANAQAYADLHELNQQISDLDSQINAIQNSTQSNIDFLESFLPNIEEKEEVLPPTDYTYMGRLNDNQIIRRLLSEKLHLSEEEINETIGEYSLVQADVGSHDDQSEDNPISMRQLVRTKVVKEDITVGQAIEELEAYTNYTAELQTKLANLRSQRTAAANRYRETKGFDEANVQAYADLHELNQQISDLETEIRERQENPEISERLNRLNKLKEISGISSLEAQIQQAKDEIEQLQSEKDNYDVTAEVSRIGDKLFKTAEVRRELAEREISREEFLQFYTEGLEMTEQQMKKLNDDYNKLNHEMGVIVTDEKSGKNLFKLVKEAEAGGDSELTAELYEQIRKNFIKAGREEQLQDFDLNHEITSPEDVEKMKQFCQMYRASVNKAVEDIKISRDELRENAQIFSREIYIIKDEQHTLELAGDSIEELKAKSAERISLRKKLLNASRTPEKDLTDEQIELLNSWQEAADRFLENKTKGEYVYYDKDGNQQILEVDTISDYEEYNQDIEFLGVPAYKENLEQLSAWEQTHDPYVFGEEVARAYEAAEAEREGAGSEVLNRIMADKQKYVETFNGIPNPHKVKYENWKTAGSTLKGMKPVSRDLPMQTRAKNTLENIGRFFGIRAPKFTRIDEHGTEVRDIKSGIATLAMDGLVVGAVIGSAVTVGPALAVAGYAAKGIVTLGNRIAARVEYSRHKDEIDNNIPVLNQADRNAREVARKEYYRENGDNKFVAWMKAKSDKYFTRKREKETEQAIEDKLNADFEERENIRNEAIISNRKLADRNNATRQTNQKQVAMSANTYNDIVRDPDAIDMDKATASIARNAVLESFRPGRGREDVNSNSTEARKTQYVKQESPLAKTEDLDENAFTEVEAPVSAITAEQIYTGRKQHVDRLNKVLTMITAAGLKFGITAWKDGFTKTEVIHHDAEYETKDVTTTKDFEVTDYETIEGYDTNGSLGKTIQQSAGKEVKAYSTVSGGTKGEHTFTLTGDEKVTAIHFEDGSKWGISASDTSNLNQVTGFTNSTVGSTLIDTDGVLNQSISWEELLKTVDGNVDGAYVSLDDSRWVSMSELLEVVKEKVAVGTHIEQQTVTEAVKTLVKEAYDEEIKKFAPELVVKAVRDGAIAGVGIGTVDAVHEAIQTTYIDGATPGRPEEVTPDAKDTFDKMAEKIEKRAIKERQEKQEQEQQEQQKNDDEER